MTQFTLASMTICAPVAAATSGRTRLVRRGAADALPVGSGGGAAVNRESSFIGGRHPNAAKAQNSMALASGRTPAMSPEL